jgi:hypothetical protein
MRALPDNNLSYPVLVEIGKGSGSGFYFRTDDKLFLVTARHVLYDVDNKSCPLRDTSVILTSYDESIKVKAPHRVKVDLSQALIRKNDLKDIALIELGDASKADASKVEFNASVQTLSQREPNLVVIPTAHLKRFDEVLVSNEVFILGYPSSLGDPKQPQIDPKKPLLRKGIIAGLNRANDTIILDCPVYFGNSGGLAIEVEETGIGQKTFRTIGVVSQFVPFIEHLTSAQLGYTNLNFENSGYSIAVPIDTILELTDASPETLEVKVTN